MMAFWDDDEEEKKPIPTGIWGSPDFGKDQYFGDRNRHFSGSPLGMGKRVLSSMAPQVRSSVVPTVRVGEPTSRSMMHPSMTPAPRSIAPPSRSPMMGETSRSMRRLPMGGRMNQFFGERAYGARAAAQGRTLKEMEENRKAKAGEDGTTPSEWGENAALAADLALGVTIAKTKEERDAAIQRAAMVGSMKALEHGVTAIAEYFDEDTAKEAVTAAATDETAKIVKGAAKTGGDPSLLGDSNAIAQGAMSSIGLAKDIAGGDDPIAATIETGAQTGGAMVGATAGTAVLPGIGTAVGAMIGSQAGKKAGETLTDIAKLRKRRMQPGVSALKDPAQYGGVSKYLA